MAISGIDPRYLSMYGTGTTGTINPAVSSKTKVSGGTESGVLNPTEFKGVVEKAVTGGNISPQGSVPVTHVSEKPVEASKPVELARVDSSRAITYGSKQAINPYAQEYNNRFAASGYSSAKHIERAPQETETPKTDDMYANYDWGKTSGLVNYIDPKVKTFIA